MPRASREEEGLAIPCKRRATSQRSCFVAICLDGVDSDMFRRVAGS